MPAPLRPRKRAEPRLDPVRWRRPGRGTLIRMIAVAALLSIGAAAAWSRPTACAQPTAATAGPSTGAAPPAEGGTRPTPDASHASASWLGRSGATAGAGAGAGRATGPISERPGGGEQSGYPVPPGRIGVPVRLAEPTALTLVHPGDQVDLLRVDGTGHGATAVATGAPVLEVTGPDDPTAGGLLVALRPAEARTAVAAQGSGFAVLIHPGAAP